VLVGTGSVAGVDVRGSAPGTIEIEPLRLVRLSQQIHGLLLTGGSAYGLESARGVQQYLEEQGIGYPATAGPVPIVPGAVIYDLAVGDKNVRPDRAMGYNAAASASNSAPCRGRIGAGTGATVGKILGYDRCMPAGLGSASVRLGTGATVGAVAVVNALGDIVDPSTGAILAGARNETGEFIDTAATMMAADTAISSPCENTVLAVVATDAPVTKEQATKIAQMGQDGIARTVSPAHTMYDGDIIFAASTGTGPETDVNAIGTAAAETVTRAILDSVGIPF